MTQCCKYCYDRVHADDFEALVFRPMIVCSMCGNKRCPHATHHDLPCTKSNAPGQRGAA